MKLDVPFFKQTTTLNYGPAALRMVLAYMGKVYGISVLERKTGIKMALKTPCLSWLSTNRFLTRQESQRGRTRML